VEDLDAPVGVLVDAAALARERKGLGPGLDQVRDALGVKGEVPRELALLLPGEDPLEILVVADGAVGIVEAPRLATEPRVVVRSELREVRVPGLGRREAAQPNCVAPRFFFASDAVTRKMLARSL